MAQQFSSRSTDSFRELLAQAGSSLLISTYQAGQLVLVRPEGKGINTHFMGVERPMGIARRVNAFALGGQSTVTVYRNLAAVGQKLDQGSAVDACYLPRRSYVTGAIDIHEMGYDLDDKLWFVNTRMSCLATLHDEYSFEPRWRPPFISAYDLTDRCHLNGLGFRDGKPRYVSYLGAYDSPAGWRQNKVSGGQVMDIQSNEPVAEGLCMPHSPRWYQNKLYFLSSGAGQLMSVVPGSAPELIAELPGFARGMDFVDRYALIGLSQIRESSTFAGLPLTKRVEERQSGVWVVDLVSGEIVAYLVFTGNVQEVFDVKLLPHRCATIVEPGSPLLAQSYELPSSVLSNLAPVDTLQTALEEANRAHMAGKFDQAIVAYQKLIKQAPEHRLANHWLGLCLVDAGRWTQAVRQLTRVVARQPDNAEAMCILGKACTRLGDDDEAMAWYDKSLATDSQFAQAHYHRGLLLLKLGKYSEAWPEYDWRWQTPEFVPFQCNQPQWQGEDISEKRLLVHSEQSDADQILFLRFLTIVAENCKELIFAGPERIAPIADQISGVAESRLPGLISADRFDVWCPLMSLPRWLGIALKDLPAPMRYLNVPAGAVVSKLKGDFKVGIAWADPASLEKGSDQSIELEQFSSLFESEDIAFFSLQTPASEAERDLLDRYGVQNLVSELSGDARVAALVDQLDLVICVDSAIAHIGGALGKPTWVLLSASSAWHWMREGSKSPWYPSVTLFRQDKDQTSWTKLIQQIKGRMVD